MPSDLTQRLGGARSSLAFKAPCRACSTSPITLSGVQTIDSVSVVALDRVLVNGQADAAENGIYVCRATTWTRARDWDGEDDVVTGTRVYVHSGSANAGSWVVTTADPITIGTTDVELDPASTLDYANVFMLGDGSAPAPSLAFFADQDTGLYRSTANSLDVTAGGSQIVTFNSSGLTLNAATTGIFNATGTAANPSFSFGADADTGIYRVGANALGVSVGGTLHTTFNSGGLTLASPGVFSGDGSGLTNLAGAFGTRVNLAGASSFTLTSSAAGKFHVVDTYNGGVSSQQEIIVQLPLPSAFAAGSAVAIEKSPLGSEFMVHAGLVTVAVPDGYVSSTSLAIGTGSKAFTTSAGAGYVTNDRVRAWSAADPTAYMEGNVASYSGTTLTLTIDTTNSSGTLSDWRFGLGYTSSLGGDVQAWQTDASTWRNIWPSMQYLRGNPIRSHRTVTSTPYTTKIADCGWTLRAITSASGGVGGNITVVLPNPAKFKVGYQGWWATVQNIADGGGYTVTLDASSWSGSINRAGTTYTVTEDFQNVIIYTDGNEYFVHADTAPPFVGAYAGSAARPSIFFRADRDTGIFSSTSNSLDITVGGSQIVTFNSSGATLQSGTGIFNRDGLATNPSYSFGADSDTGLYRSASNTLNVAVGGTLHTTFNSGGLTLASPGVFSGNGSGLTSVNPDIVGRTEDTAPDIDADYGIDYDASATANRKFLWRDLLAVPTLTLNSASVTMTVAHLNRVLICDTYNGGSSISAISATLPKSRAGRSGSAALFKKISITNHPGAVYVIPYQHGTSATSNSIGTGAKTFTTQAGLDILAGDRLHVQSSGTALAWMRGTVTSYSGTSLVMSIEDTSSSGSYADWLVTDILEGTLAGLNQVRWEIPYEYWGWVTDAKGAWHLLETLNTKRGNIIKASHTIGTPTYDVDMFTGAGDVFQMPGGSLGSPSSIYAILPSYLTIKDGYTFMHALFQQASYTATAAAYPGFVGNSTDTMDGIDANYPHVLYNPTDAVGILTDGSSGWRTFFEHHTRQGDVMGVRLSSSNSAYTTGLLASAAGTIYLYPLESNRLAVPGTSSGGSGRLRIHSPYNPLSLSLSAPPVGPAASASRFHDVFVYQATGNSGLQMVLGPAYVGPARGSGAGTSELTLYAGIPVNAYALSGGIASTSARYVGRIFTNGSSQAVALMDPWDQADPVQTAQADGSINYGWGLTNTASATRRMHGRVEDTATNTTTFGLRLEHATTGTAAASFGVGFEHVLENASGTNVVAMTDQTEWVTATAASEAARRVIRGVYAGAIRNVFSVAAGGEVGINTVASGAGGVNLDIRPSASNPTYSAFQMVSQAGNTFQFTVTDALVTMKTATNHPYAIGTNNTTRLYAAAAGSVGVGRPAVEESPDRTLHAGDADAVTAAVTYVARLTHETSGTAAVAFGVGTEYELENASGTNKIAGALDFVWSDATNATEDADFVVRNMAAGAAIAEKFRVSSVGAMTAVGSSQILSGTAIPAGGTAGSGYKLSSTSNFGIFFGSGAPSLSAAQGSLYLRSDGSSTSTRLYVNTDGSTTWTNVTTAA